MPRILCFGDSITYGAWDSGGGWVARIRKRIDKICIDSDLQSFILTYNLGVSSDTTDRLLARFDSEIESHSKERGDNLIIISIGTNDSMTDTSGVHPVELPQFEENIRSLVKKAKTSALGVIFLGNLPVDESKTQPFRDQPEINLTNANIKLYDHATQKICQEMEVKFIPVFNEAIATKYRELLFSDGLHPNENGHAFLADKVWKYPIDNNWVVS
jgi:lysophospholipase L1-like esterase